MPNVPTGHPDTEAGQEGQGGMDDYEGLLTVAEAAARVGLSERTLARILESDGFAARTVTGYGQAGPATLVPPPLVAELRASYEMGRAIFDPDGEAAPPAGGPGGRPSPPGPEAASLAAQVASARETILRADQARDRAEGERARAEAALERALLERDAETQRLHAALTRAQDALTQALTALTHEQHRTRQLMTVQAQLVHALPAPDPPPAPDLTAPDVDPLVIAPPSPTAPPSAGATGGDDATRGDDGEPTLDRETLAAIQAQIEAARPRGAEQAGFWTRLWRGITD